MERRFLRQASFAVALGLLLTLQGFASEPKAWPDPKNVAYQATVIRVLDGDTVWLQGDGRRRIRARIIGIDAPETCQAFGRESWKALRNLVLREQVGVQTYGLDTFGRELVVIWLAGQDVGAQMVSQGLAWAYIWKGEPSVYISLEEKARQEKLGIFEQSNPERPRDFRQRHGPCRPPQNSKPPAKGTGIQWTSLSPLWG